ncbi:hypothetical protein TVAG_487150 [Trichomonas vaginalis G3]|uniref:receptor protein-tyrosine kinase n=1 Tax=Trichomonas vaginalis (strain ATCC PRA-98 / G3) TaxID=412133 RepID=A2DZE3_TRIV3|nr:glycine-rich protein family [Trichomonas vaginalis G3]EAY14272.1 hypothetical protein TVAG_487150 [Trichomonas vaginalis G3]KAI5491867.1 glycine-rich protein family [Trichomonas vaginalis G3]|eukprot:XP_001326495.1 hypothetical protein [Trichomonas vaginalis G3]
MIHYQLSKTVGKENVTRYHNQYVFKYPCPDDQYECSPYTVSLSPGRYLFEAWGSRGGFNVWNEGPSTPGLGGYTSGALTVRSPLIVYLYIGSSTYFNSFFSYVGTENGFVFGGASSDVRLHANESFDWSDPLSLRSRIMVSGGGGGAEWATSIGGNGGGIQGGIGYYCYEESNSCFDLNSGGGSQTSGGTPASTKSRFSGIPGLFGISNVKYSSSDFGAVGGNGYYSGASIDYAGAAGGGSSFISGYEGCIALKGPTDETPSPSNSSIHYSKIFFTNPIMIQGNQTMPLYYNPESRGIGNNDRGAIRITILSNDCSCNHRYFHSNIYFLLSIVFIVS